VILLVERDPAERARVQEALARYRMVTAGSYEEAQAVLAEHPVRVVIAAFSLAPSVDGAATGLDLLREVETSYPQVKRLLVASYEELPKAVRGKAHRLVSHVLSRPLNTERLVQLVEDLLLPTSTIKSLKDRPAVDWEDALDMLKWTAGHMAKVSGLIVRQLPREPPALQLQFVLPKGEAFDRFREVLVLRWKWPVKPQGAKLPPRGKRHPVLRFIGPLWEDQELFAIPFGDGNSYVYLALLPWRRQANVTVAIGIHTPTEEERYFTGLSDTHAYAINQLAEFAIPSSFQSSVSAVRYSPEYDWVLTKNYVGPDRRKGPTTFLNRFVLIGQRKHASKKAFGGVFVDGFKPAVWLAVVAYLVLSAIDSWFTFVYVRKGAVGELNPVWRFVLRGHPMYFVLGKNLVALTSIFAIARFQLARLGWWMLGGSLVGYLVLDGYWLYLIFR
jgi:CheY-like chemotaxis protein